MNKKLIRLTEQDLHRIIKESVNRILFENSIEGHNWAKIQRPQGIEKIDVDIDSSIPYISIGSWEAEGSEAMQAINAINNIYMKTNDYNLAIKEFIDGV